MRVLTPCPPSKHCKICESRVEWALGDVAKKDPFAKYRHQALYYWHELRKWAKVKGPKKDVLLKQAQEFGRLGWPFLFGKRKGY